MEKEIGNGKDHNGRFVALMLKDDNMTSADPYIVIVQTNLPKNEIRKAVKAAASDYLHTPEGRQIWEQIGKKFDYDDFCLYVPDVYCKNHGFVLMNRMPLDLVDDYFARHLASPYDDYVLSIPFRSTTVTLCKEDVDDIMDNVMLGSVHFCERSEAIDSHKELCTAQQISAGRSIRFYILEEDTAEDLTPEKFEKGLHDWLLSCSAVEIKKLLKKSEDKWGFCIDTSRIDSEYGDSILQYALFGGIRFD